MGKLEAWICIGYAFAPAIAFFIRFVAKEPLRIILYMIGAFFWLVSLLLTSLIWQVTRLIITTPIPILLIFIMNEEIARVLLFIVTRKAYDGLIKIGTSNKLIIPEIALLAHDSRHTLSFVCGLGFGTLACFFSVANVIADMAKDGIPGFPPAVENSKCPIHRTANDADVPFSYSIVGCLLIFLNACWTVMQWDSLHKFFKDKKLMEVTNNPTNGEEESTEHENKHWWLGLVISVIAHVANSLLSVLSPGGWHWYVLIGHFIILGICIVLTLYVAGFKKPTSWCNFLLTSHILPCKSMPRQPETAGDDNVQVIQPQNQHSQVIRRNNPSPASITPTAV
uniref:Uncharacterized protein n=1 Tax=Panagrolaimus sp. JU765 TaxID=591449 RepID=A0AC34R4S4_9BILA